MMARRLFAVLLFVACWIVTAMPISARQAADVDQYAGTWSGTYDGAGTGQFEMTLVKAQDGAMAGKVDVTTEGGNYSADLKSVVFDGSKMTAKYDFPLDPSAEVIMTATFEGSAAKGTWSLRPKGQPDELASGGIAVTKK
jgi:hypothetical protein